MNKVLWTDYTGGMPLRLDDLKFEQDAVRAAIAGITQGLFQDDTGYVVSGCVITGSLTAGVGTLNWTAGVMVIGGEVCVVDAGSLVCGISDTPHWKVTTSYDANGTKVYQDMSTNDVYQIRKATMLGGSPAGTYLDVSTCKYLSPKWRAIGCNEYGIVSNPVFQNNWYNYNSTYYSLAFYKDAFGRVHIRGNVADSAASGNFSERHLFTLPAGFRPTKKTYFVISSYFDYKHAYLVIDTNGYVSITHENYTTDVPVDIGEVVFQV